MTDDQLWDRTSDAFAQLTRYGGAVVNKEILDVLWALTDLNDNVANGRDKKIIQADVEKMKALLDKVAAGCT